MFELEKNIRGNGDGESCIYRIWQPGKRCWGAYRKPIGRWHEKLDEYDISAGDDALRQRETAAVEKGGRTRVVPVINLGNNKNARHGIATGMI